MEIHDLKSKLPETVKNAIEEKATESGQVTATFVMDRLNEAFDNATGKCKMTIITAVEKAASCWGFLPVLVMQEEKCQALWLLLIQE